MKRKMFFMGTLALVLAGVTFWSCQKDEVFMNAEDGVMLKKGKTVAMAIADPLTWEGEICAGTAHELKLEFPDQGLNNGGNQILTNVQVQIYDAGLNDYVQILGGNYISTQTFEYTFPEEGEYLLRHKIGAGGFTDVNVPVVNCDNCEESFSYEPNEDGSYTFTYVPAEDMAGAEVVFTFAQSVVVDGLEDWTENGATRQKTMDLVACKEYVWTVTLTPDCKGQGQSDVNAWTDFNVGNEWVSFSKKGDLENIVIQCSDE